MPKVTTKEHRIVASHLRDLMASYKESEDLITVGAYTRGSNPKIDKAISIHDDLTNLLRQQVEESFTIEEIFDRMLDIARKAETAVDPSFR